MAKWQDIATPVDRQAQNFYTQLVALKLEGNGWQDTWLQLPSDLYLSFSRGIRAGEASYFFDGFEWQPVAYYSVESPAGPEQVYLRLPANGELAEEERIVEILTDCG